MKLRVTESFVGDGHQTCITVMILVSLRPKEQDFIPNIPFKGPQIYYGIGIQSVFQDSDAIGYRVCRFTTHFFYAYSNQTEQNDNESHGIWLLLLANALRYIVIEAFNLN